jgi:hypothetical protein
MPERAGSWEAPTAYELRALNTSALSVYVWGCNEAFQISCEKASAISEPVLAPVVQGKNLVFVAGSRFHTAYVAGTSHVCMENCPAYHAVEDRHCGVFNRLPLLRPICWI